jgi:hypothetical protein
MQIDETHQSPGAAAANTYECCIADSQTLYAYSDDYHGMAEIIAEWSKDHLGYVPDYRGWDIENDAMWFENFRTEADAWHFKLYWTGHTGNDCYWWEL